jgi:predicted RND superfamily exporter protein
MVLLLMVALRSFKFGLVAVVPLVIPTAIAFGIWGIFDGWVNFTMAVVIGAVTGIVDDDAVHLLNEYLRGRREYKLDPEDAIRHTLRTVGSALAVMTVVLICGILVMTQSAFLPNSGSSTLMALAIGAALVFDLLLLPCLILMLDRDPQPATAPATV